MQGDVLVLNAATGYTNVVESDDWGTMLIDTTTYLYNKLLSISGPFSRWAVLLYDPMVLTGGNNVSAGMDVNREINVKAFLTDGIHALARIEFGSPIQRYIKDKLIKYIGMCTDGVCHDGTTTAMLFACQLLVELVGQRNVLRYASIPTIERVFIALSDGMMRELQGQLVTPKYLVDHCGFASERDAACAIAYMQAYTSSGGSHGIAVAVATAFSATPEIAWKYAFGQNYPGHETDATGVECVISEWEASIPTTVLNTNALNNRYGREFVSNDADIIFMRRGLQGYSLDFNHLIRDLSLRGKPGQRQQPLVVLIPSNNLAQSDASFGRLLEAVEQCDSLVLLLTYHNSLRVTSNGGYLDQAISAKANVPFLDSSTLDVWGYEECLIRNAKIKVSSNTTHLANLMPEYSGIGHPGEKNPEKFLHYIRIRDEIIAELDICEAQSQKSSDVNELHAALTLMSANKEVFLRVGGSGEDQQTLLFKIEDAEGAARAAVRSGMLYNGTHRMFLSLCEAARAVTDTGDPWLATDAPSTFDDVFRVLSGVMRATLGTLMRSVYGPVSSGIKLDDMLKKELTNPVEYYDIAFKSIHDTTVSDITKMHWFDCLRRGAFSEVASAVVEHGESLPPSQVGELVSVMLHRCRETILRAALVENAIVPGTIWDNERNISADYDKLPEGRDGRD